MGLLQTILGSLAGSQPDAAPEEHPADTLLKEILSGGAPSEDPSASPAPSPSSSGSDTAALNEVMGMPPDVAAKVTGNPGMYPNLAAILGGKQTKVPPRKPLDYLIAAASPLANAFASMMMTHRRSDRKGAFFSGLASGGINTLANEASRPERMRQAQREKDIQDILLQQKLRGTPTSGVDPNTGKPKFQYQTGETVQGIVPEPKAPHPVETRNVKDAQGNEIQQEYDPVKKTWVTSTREVTAPDTTGKQVTQRVPFMTPKQKPAAKRELKVGSDVPGGKKNDEQYYWVSDQPNEKPQPSGLFRAASDRPTREGDINRAEKHQVNQWAVKALADSHKRLGPKAKPEEYANAAVETFRQAAGTSPELASKASEVATAIHTLGRNIKSGDELAEMIKTFLTQPAQTQK